MLRAPVASMLDEIVVMDPVKRCITVAAAITRTVNADSPYAQVLEKVGGNGVNDDLVRDIKESTVFDTLKAEALARHTGKRMPMPALVGTPAPFDRGGMRRV